MITYMILYNDPVSHIVTLRWQDGANFRDEAFNLELILPGAMKMFSDMGLPFNYDAALTFLNTRCQQMIDDHSINVTPPMWNSSVVYQQVCPTTPSAYIPDNQQPPA
jgi:hypothetical protein